MTLMKHNNLTDFLQYSILSVPGKRSILVPMFNSCLYFNNRDFCEFHKQQKLTPTVTMMLLLDDLHTNISISENERQLFILLDWVWLRTIKIVFSPFWVLNRIIKNKMFFLKNALKQITKIFYFPMITSTWLATADRY